MRLCIYIPTHTIIASTFEGSQGSLKTITTEEESLSDYTGKNLAHSIHKNVVNQEETSQPIISSSGQDQVQIYQSRPEKSINNISEGFPDIELNIKKSQKTSLLTSVHKSDTPANNTRSKTKITGSININNSKNIDNLSK